MISHPSKILRLILGDQLNINHTWFKNVEPSVSYVMMEIRSETDYVNHHIQKVLGIFASMRNFADLLRSKGHHVIYIKLNDANNLQQFDLNIKELIHQHSFEKFEYLLPDEYRVDQHLKSLCKNINIPSEAFDTEHFYTSRTELKEFFKGKKTYLMESFYRYMRKKHLVLVDDQLQPLMGKWNFDADNREKLPKNHKPIAPLSFDNNVEEIYHEILNANIECIGSVQANNFLWPINREQALQLLNFFTEHCLALFGTYQDAMTPHEWSLYHSRLSFALNIKLISPKEVVDAAIAKYYSAPEQIEYHQLEGFVRQIIGWREYMRGIYWAQMPGYADLNFFNHNRALPSWFWTGNTKMNCLKHSIQQSLQYSYAHHIQRLMITGNFALLAGIHPDEIDQWYLGIYIDAFEWVEITNTRGMSQFADAGIVGTKPYVSSSSYINKMSSYCGTCYYNHKEKTSEKSCPFNSLYWNFYHQHEKKLSKNPRIGMMYKVWDKMPQEQKTAILNRSQCCLENLDNL